MKIEFKSVQEMALKHISAYIAEKAESIRTKLPYNEPLSQTIGTNFISSSRLNTKENRRLNKLVLDEHK